MRQVFASARLENVEGIARLLEQHGIEVRITHGRSYKGRWGGRRSYRDSDGGALPAVWVVKSEDQPRARVLLREAGLLDTTRTPAESYLAPSVHDRAEAPVPATPQRRAFRYKLGLLVAIAAVLALAFGAMRRPKPAMAPVPVAQPRPAARVVPPVALPAPAKETPLYVADTPPALAALLVATELNAQRLQSACIAIDGQDPPAARLAEFAPAGATLRPASACGDDALVLDIRDYRTDGTGTGTIRLGVRRPDADGRPDLQQRTLEVQRDGSDWRVLRVVGVQ